MERRRSKPVGKLPETINSLVGLKSHLTSAWVESVCSIIKNVSSSTSTEESNDFVFIEVQSIRDKLSVLTVQVNEQNKRRRQILNEFLDLKGNIRVFCRVKPLDSKNSRASVASDARNVIIKLTETKKKVYSFDRVFQPNSSQDDVFLEIEPVIKSVIDGYNACIFAYGQTGTGKTYTMEGLPESPGIVPRAIKGLFRQIEESNHMFIINFSMLEIYMGNLRDLLLSQATKPFAPLPPSLVIHTDAKGEIDIENLVTIKVNDFNQVFKLYKLGCRNRATASTYSNSTSSRSHCMIRVSITCPGATERRRETNKIWLVDLGGSERVFKTRATGRIFDEGKAINLSLSALGDVINSLQHKSSHIPYRNSKLTQVLKDSLGKDSKTLMLVHISPKEDDLCETICSLNFATRAKNIHLGQDESTEEQEKKEVVMMNLQKMMEEIEKEREIALREMRILNERLEKLSGKPNVIEEEKEVEEEIEVTPKIRKSKARRDSDHFPSFMRPTASSSRRLSGSHFSVISNGPGLKYSRRNSMISESVCLPVKKKKNRIDYSSVCDSSERSVSKSTCVMRLNRVGDDDDGASSTVYSQDISECDIKLVVSEQKPNVEPRMRPPKSTKKARGAEFSKINNWLDSQSENRSCFGDKEPLRADLFSEKLVRSAEYFTTEKITGSEIKRERLKDLSEDESLYPPSLGYDGLSQDIEDVWFEVDYSPEWKQENESDLKKTLPETEFDVADRLMQKVRTVWFSIILGIGFIDVGYGHDFFNGLTNQ